MFVALSGCALVPPPQPTVPLPVEPEPPPPAPVVVVPQGTAKELFRQGVDALQHGEGEKAKPLLQQVLVLEPGHKNASSLLSQIDADPVEMLGKEYFPYKVQQGDTLSLIARRHLGDPFKFYILARYNDIIMSDNLEAGRSIKIPGKKPAPGKVAPVIEQPSVQLETSNLRLSEAKTLYANGRFADAIHVLEQLRVEGGASAEVDDFLITAYVGHAKKLADAGRIAEAKKVLAKASSTYPTNEHLKRQLEQTGANQRAEQTYNEGNQWLNDGELIKAYAAYTRTLTLEPEHSGAKAALKKLKPQVVEAYYADSVRARRRQNFTEALDSLNKLLEIEPNHELAKANRSEIQTILDREQSRLRRQ
jgi:tetratricopeptide (TPR) repeat protein